MLYLEREKCRNISIVQCLLYYFPDIVKTPSNDGRLILHGLVDRLQPNLEFVRIVSRLYPAAVNQPTNALAKDTPLEIASTRKPNVFVQRELLLSYSDQKYHAIFRDLNWQCRKLAIFMSFPKHSDDRSFSTDKILLLNLYTSESYDNFNSCSSSSSGDESDEDDEQKVFMSSSRRRTGSIKNIMPMLYAADINLWKKTIMYL